MITTSRFRLLLTVSAAFVTLLAGTLPDHPSERRESGGDAKRLKILLPTHVGVRWISTRSNNSTATTSTS